MFDHCLYFNTTALARALEREWALAFKPFGLTPSQAFMMRVVLAQPGLLQSEVAREMAISRSTATRTLDGLQQLNLLERRATPNDGRESSIHATGAGLMLKDRLDAASGAVTLRLKKSLGEKQFDATVADVKKVRSAMR